MTILEDLKTHLIANISGLNVKNVFIDYVPDQPDDVITIYGYGGSAPDLALSRDEQAKKVQIFSRGTVGKTAVSKLNTVEGLLYTKYGYTLVNNRKCIITPVSEIAFLKFENNRFHYIMNFEIVTSRD